MIISDVKADIVKGNTAVLFGTGDISVGVIDSELNDPEKPSVCVLFEQLCVRKNIGDEVSESEIKRNKPKVLFHFDNKNSIDAVINKLQEAKKVLVAKEEGWNSFIVPLKNIFVPECFKNTNPAAVKIMKCYEHFVKHGRFDRDIVVDKNLRIQDGYVAYVIASFLGLEEVPVIVNGRIPIKIGHSVMRFFTNEVNVYVDFYGDVHSLSDFNTKTKMVLSSGDQISEELFSDNSSAACEYLIKIKNVFKPKFNVFFRNVSMNVAMESDLVKKLKALGIEVENDD